MSQRLARSDVEVERVQLRDLHDLEDYLYRSKLEVADEKLHQNDGNESELPDHSCWCSKMGPGANLTPLLKMISKYFSELENILFNYTLDDQYFNQEFVAAREEILEIRESLKHASLRFAIRQGYCEFVSGQTTKTRTIGWDKLKLAITSDQVDVVRLFAASSKLDDKLRDLGLEEAAYQGRMEILNLLMCDAAVDVNGCNETSPLKAAAAAGQVDAMKMLIQAGADIEAWGKTSKLKERDHTPLIAAVARNQFRAVTVLIDAGAVVDDELAPENAPLRVALEADSSGMVDLLLQHGAQADLLGLPYVWEKILGLAVRQEHLELAKKALKGGANVNRTVPLFGTLLKHAVTLGNEQMTRLLMDYGADINYFGSAYELGGNCALLAAAADRKTDIFLLLLRHGALIDKANGTFGNLMQTVAHFGYVDRMAAILEIKRDIDVDDTGCSRISLSPLEMAMNSYLRVRRNAGTGEEYVQVMRLLLAHKVKSIRRRSHT